MQGPGPPLPISTTYKAPFAAKPMPRGLLSPDAMVSTLCADACAAKPMHSEKRSRVGMRRLSVGFFFHLVVLWIGELSRDGTGQCAALNARPCTPRTAMAMYSA